VAILGCRSPQVRLDSRCNLSGRHDGPRGFGLPDRGWASRVDLHQERGREVVLELEKLAFSNISDFIEVHADGSVHIDMLRATRDRAAAIHDVVVRRSAEGSGNEGASVKLTRIQLCNKLKALDMLARHLGMFPMSERRSRRPKLSAP
jgi:hypothetical protein